MVRTVSARFAGGELIAPPVWHLLYAVLCFFALLEFQHVFTLFIVAASSPFWLFPQYTLRIIFFAAPWTEEVLETSCNCLRILACSLVLQATRMGMISTLLKEKRTWLYGAMITTGGIINIAVCIGGATMLKAPYIPILTLTGDLCLSLFLLFYFGINSIS